MRRAVAVPRDNQGENSYCSPGNIPQMGDPIGFTRQRLGHFSRALVRVPVPHRLQRALAKESTHRRTYLAHVARYLIVLAGPQLYGNAHSADGLRLRLGHSLSHTAGIVTQHTHKTDDRLFSAVA